MVLTRLFLQDPEGPVGLTPEQVTHVLAITVDPAFAQSLGSFEAPQGCPDNPPPEGCTPALSAEEMAESPAGAALLSSLAQSIADQLGVDVSVIDISSIGLTMEDDGSVSVETGDNITSGRRLQAGITRGWALCTSRGALHSCTIDVNV